jgi:hypothetical protein
MKQFRHGDVLLQQIRELPAGLEPLPHMILAYGELTGHAHRVIPATGGKLYRNEGGLVLHVFEDGLRVVHEEHASIDLPQGTYKVWRQREYSPEEIRIVRD